jgi:hypothetical protein
MTDVFIGGEILVGEDESLHQLLLDASILSYGQTGPAMLFSSSV